MRDLFIFLVWLYVNIGCALLTFTHNYDDVRPSHRALAWLLWPYAWFPRFN